MGSAGAEELRDPGEHVTRRAAETAIWPGTPSQEVLAQARDVDALVCASDLMAIGAVRAPPRRGLRVPHVAQPGWLGWDNIVDSEYVTPSLATVAPDLRALAGPR